MSREEPLVFACEGVRLLGILHHAPEPTHIGVVVVVGGPQYRVGSHRQFVLLARYLAQNGIPVLRFDYRGMGDSEGTPVSFEDIDADISAAIDALCAELPELRRIMLWGLCDAASAAMFYAHRDLRVAGVALLNPWIRTEATQARTYLRHYYVSQLKDPEFWRRIFSGRVPVLRAAGAFVGNLSLALRPPSEDLNTGGADMKAIPFPERMLRGLQAFSGKVLLILSGNDLTAAEFRGTISASRRWRRLLARSSVIRRELPQATHTFSCQAWRDQVAAWTLEWIRSW
jgi:exosortase A-associated hydrolase 1